MVQRQGDDLECRDADPVAMLRDLLGTDVVLLPVRPLTKKPVGNDWSRRTVEIMRDQEYLATLRRGNIGVLLGGPDRLVTVDWDTDSLLSDFLGCNESLKETLITRRVRGGNVWMRMQGEYPERTQYLDGPDGGHVGEWRAGGGQTIIYGQAIDKGETEPVEYRFVNRAHPVSMAFSSLKWPEGVRAPRLKQDKVYTAKDRHSVHSQRQGGEGKKEESGKYPPLPPHSLYGCVHSLSDILRLSRLDDVHQSCERIWVLARSVKTIEVWEGKYTPQQHSLVFSAWYESNLRYLRPEQSKQEYFMEYLSAYERAKYPLGGEFVEQAWQRAQSEPLPQEALQFEDRKHQLLVAMCQQMQILVGDAPFFLSTHVIQRLLGQDSHTTAWKWIQILRRTRSGNMRKATEYRWIGSLQEPDAKSETE